MRVEGNWSCSPTSAIIISDYLESTGEALIKEGLIDSFVLL